jgi:cytochrome P450
MRRPPGPRGHWLLGSLPDRRRDALGFYERIHREYGDIIGFRLGAVPVVMLCHPKYAKHVLLDHADKYGKGGMPERLRPALGDGLLTAEGDFWLRQRRLMQPAFHREKLAALVESMAEAAEAHVESWQPGELDIAQDMLTLTMGIAGKGLFGAELGGKADAVGPALSVALEESNRRLLAYFDLPLWVPTPGNLRLQKAIRALDEVVFHIIEQRRRGESAGNDLLALLMEARDEETGAAMDDRQLRNEVLTLFLAGHETTASALAWMCHLLAQHPEEQERLRAEAFAVCGMRPVRDDDLRRLERCNMAFQESMRLYPPAWGIPRASRVDDVIDGYHVPRRTLVFVSTWLIHRHREFWPDAEVFDPGRFDKQRSEGRPRQAFIPFGTGQRTCIGGSFATVESLVTVATLLRRYRILPVPEHVPEPLPLVVLRARNGIKVRLDRI